MRAQHRREAPPRLSALLAAAALIGGAAPPASAAPTAPSAPSASPEITAQAQAAKERYARGDFAGAARAYEALWESTRAPKYIYNAGMAREAAGQAGLAVRHWRRFLATAGADVTPAERAELRKRVDITAAENPALEVQLEPPGAFGPATVLTLQPPPELVAAGVPPIDLRDPIAGDIDETAAHLTTSLDPGTWILSLSGLRGAADQTLTIEIPPGPSRTIRPIALTARHVTFSIRTAPRLWLHPGADVIIAQGGAPLQRIHLQGRPVDITAPEGPIELTATADGYHPTTVPLDLHLERPTAPLTLRLKLDPRAHLPARLGLGLGLGLPGLALLSTGSALASDLTRVRRAADDIDFFDTDPIAARNGQAFLAGTGGGLLLASSMAALRPRASRWWISGSAVGTALSLTGLSAYFAIVQNRPAPGDHNYIRYSNRLVATEVVFGLGTGLLTGTLVGLTTHLLLERRARRNP